MEMVMLVVVCLNKKSMWICYERELMAFVESFKKISQIGWNYKIEFMQNKMSFGWVPNIREALLKNES